MSHAITVVDLEEAGGWIRAGRIVVYPTETYYGLAVDPTMPAAVEALFDLKGRDSRMAVPLIAASVEDVRVWCGPMSPVVARLAELFWPGPLSLIFSAPPAVATAVHGGAGTIAVRVSSHPVARQLATSCGGLITATSANRSGEPPATAPADVGDLVRDPRVALLDGGVTTGGEPSTIVDPRGAVPVLVRAGAIAWNRVLESLER